MTEDVNRTDRPVEPSAAPTSAAPTSMSASKSAAADSAAPATTSATAAQALPEAEVLRLTGDIIAALKTVFDPEIPADIYELGLVYRIDVGDDRTVTIDMTLTTPNCPSAQELPIMVENAVASISGVGNVNVNVVWDPPWDPSRMSDEARSLLNMW